MALQKQPVQINFNLGLDTKSDPKQLQIGKFLALRNSVFGKAGALVKRNGFPVISTLPDANQTTLTTLNNNLLATGSNLYAYSRTTNQWLNQGIVQPIRLETQPVVRVSTSQTKVDAAVTQDGLACTVYMDSSLPYYQVSDIMTGQQVIARTALPATAASPRVYQLGYYFIITFLSTVSATTHLQFIAIPIATPGSPIAAQDISSNVSSLASGYDAIVANDNLYISWKATANAIRTAYVSPSLNVAAAASVTSYTADLMSLADDPVNSRIWVTFWSSASSGDGYSMCYNYNLGAILTPTQVISNTTVNQITSIVDSGVLSVFYEVDNTYAYDGSIHTNYISSVTITSAGVVGTPAVLLRSVGLASKAFTDTSGTSYMLTAYGETNQPTYFLIDTLGNIYMRLAYQNGGGYITGQVLPSVSSIDTDFYVPYLIKDFLAPVNKGTSNPTGTPVNAIYTQTGINLAKFSINIDGQYSSEIAGSLHLTGGQLWQYDGIKPVEHSFHVWPENVEVTTATGSGSIAAGTYYYAFCYEWTDGAGNLQRSAPSIPVKQVTSTASSTNTIKVPTLRLTYKITPNPVRIVGYRWSVSQPVYYQFTSITSPTVNDPTVDYVTITDTLADSSILGQTLLYTSGGVLENIAAPASIHSALYKNRLFLIDAEDRNLLWYSKQVIENTPIELSDLLTIFVSPTTGAQGSTGPMTAVAAMDDKLIIFKENALYYMIGTGPDNTGANNDFSEPIYITASVGCSNPASIVLMPNGIMFQSNKGIWLLGRDLQTSYIGSPVEAYNNFTVKSAKSIPGTNEVRFILDGNVTLMYDYFYGQWGTFNNISAISGTLYNGADTYLSSAGRVYQETDGSYLDGSSPVLLSFTTSWINVAGVQGLERIYEMLLLGNYYSPFKLNVKLAYDYNPSATQATLVLPDNYAVNYGDDAQYGSGGNYGGPGNILQARIFPEQQKCESFQITVEEVYDPQFGGIPGQGLSLSGINMIIGAKKGSRTSKAAQSFG
jgi:hypothetical protein